MALGESCGDFCRLQKACYDALYIAIFSCWVPNEELQRQMGLAQATQVARRDTLRLAVIVPLDPDAVRIPEQGK